MGVFGKLFSKNKAEKSPRGFHELTIKGVRYLCDDTVEIAFEIPSELEKEFGFNAGQYINLSLQINDKEERRSYSLSSAPHEGTIIAVKKVKNGIVSNWLYENAKIGMTMWVSKPEGAFVLPNDSKNIIAFAAGSGITPILSIAKSSSNKGSFRLYYGNRDEANILYKQELDELSHISKTILLSREQRDGYETGRIDKEFLSNLIKSDLSILKSDCFLVCGPEEMIVAVKESLNLFGVADSKIVYELFTTPTLLKPETPVVESNFKGSVDLTIQLDGDIEEIVIDEKTTILDAANKAGLDAPYSCRGGVCSSCKCKIIEGSAQMRMNYVLTDSEVKDGYVLGCQAVPTSPMLKVSFDV